MLFYIFLCWEVNCYWWSIMSLTLLSFCHLSYLFSLVDVLLFLQLWQTQKTEIKYVLNSFFVFHFSILYIKWYIFLKNTNYIKWYFFLCGFRVCTLALLVTRGLYQFLHKEKAKQKSATYFLMNCFLKRKAKYSIVRMYVYFLHKNARIAWIRMFCLSTDTNIHLL